MPNLFKKLLQHKEDEPFHGRKDLVFLKHFNFVKSLGTGTYSHVYHVRRVDDGREYALKATDLRHLSQNERRSLVEEVRYLASLNHPNIVRYYEAFVEEEWLCIITELVLGGDVATLIRRTGSSNSYLPEKRVWSILIQTALALEELHNCKILHRDVKPANLLLKDGVVVKLADFGISRILERVFTRTQIGTPPYMSPEMWLGRPYSLSSDVWALGCVALELAILRPAFAGDSEAEVKAAIVRSRVPLLPRRYSDDMNDVIMAMLTRDPIKRPTITEVLAMPQLRRHWGDLPAELVSQMREHRRSAPSHHILKPIAIPAHLQQLNSLLPPAQYESGGTGLALYLARPLSSSTGDLVALGAEDDVVTPGPRTAPSMVRSSSHDGGLNLVESSGDSFGDGKWDGDLDALEATRRLRRKSVQVSDALRLRRRAEVCVPGGDGTGDMFCAFQSGDDWWKARVEEHVARKGKPPASSASLLGLASGVRPATTPAPETVPSPTLPTAPATAPAAAAVPAATEQKPRAAGSASKVRFDVGVETDNQVGDGAESQAAKAAMSSSSRRAALRTASESRATRGAGMDFRRNSVQVADVTGQRTAPRTHVELMSNILSQTSFSNAAARRFELCPISRNSFLVPSTSNYTTAKPSKPSSPGGGGGRRPIGVPVSAVTGSNAAASRPVAVPSSQAKAGGVASVPVRSAPAAATVSPFARAPAPANQEPPKKTKNSKGNFFKRIFK